MSIHPISRWRGRSVSVAAVISLLLTAALTACAASDQSSGSGGSGAQTVTVAYGQPLESLDPVQSDQNNVNTIDDLLYDTLVTYDSSNNLVGELATSFKLTPDAKAVDITLRSGVTFHDGTTLTADDVKYSLDRYVALGQGIASELADYGSTTVISPTRLVINLKEPDALFLGDLSKIYILEQKLVQANAGSDHGQSWLQTHDAGSGPYSLTVGTNPVKLTKYAGYWNPLPGSPQTYVLEQIADSATEAAQLKSGGIDIALDLQTSDAKALSGSNVKVAWEHVPNTAYIFMNTQYGPTANPVVRQALRLSYDYSGALSEIRGGEGEIENGPIPQTLTCTLSTPPFSQNLAKAKSMLAAAGLSNLTVTLRYQPSLSDQVREATLLQSDLKSIGVTLVLVPITFPQYLTSLSNPKQIPEMTLIQDTAPEPDAGSYLVTAYDSSSIGSTNRGAYSNPTVDKLLAKAMVTTSESQRCGLYKQAETQINKDAVSISMYTLWGPVGYSTRVSGIEASQLVYPISLRTVKVG